MPGPSVEKPEPETVTGVEPFAAMVVGEAVTDSEPFEEDAESPSSSESASEPAAA